MDAPYCACGCGQLVTVWRGIAKTYVVGHSARIKPPCSYPKRTDAPKAVINKVGKLCECGCGQPTKSKGSNVSRFIKGHCARKYKVAELRDAKTADAFYCLKRKYGISYEDYYALLNAQSNACAICKTDNPGNTRGGPNVRFAVDHSHETGQVRGLLCHACNKGLGNLRDSPIVLKRAINYLRKHVIQ